MDMQKVINLLREEGRYFCSEADFQFALGRKIKELYPTVDIRFEFTPQEMSKIKLDLCIMDNGTRYPIELKYKTKTYEFEVDKEKFKLRDQQAHDIGCYDYMRDVARIENLKKILEASNNTDIKYGVGYAIMLTNDPIYWNEPVRITNYDNFRIYNGVTKQGTMAWSSEASEGTKQGRGSIQLVNSYKI